MNWKWAKNIWFELFYWQKSSWIRWYIKLFRVSANKQIFKKIAGLGSDNDIYYWKSKGLCDEKINSLKMPDYGINPKINYYGTKEE